MPLTLQDIKKLGVDRALARCYSDEASARAFLDNYGYPMDRVPPFQAADLFWPSICRGIDNGRVEGEDRFDRLVMLAHEGYVGQQVFADAVNMARSGSAGEESASSWAKKREQFLQQGRLPRLRIRGGDHRLFEIEDIPLETHVRDIILTVVDEYDEFRKDSSGRERSFVADLERDDSFQRLHPDVSLRDVLEREELTEDSTIHVLPETTAGTPDPATRDTTLRRALNQIRAYANKNPGFSVEPDNDRLPLEYRLLFTVDSFGPPASPGGPPSRIHEHRVQLKMLAHDDFPNKPPSAYWKTPIFHPNILWDPESSDPARRAANGLVCLGALQEHYRPGMDFGQLCQMLVAMAGYRNYELANGYNVPALEWARTSAGQTAIVRIGGVAFTKGISAEGVRSGNPLKLKPIGPVLPSR